MDSQAATALVRELASSPFTIPDGSSQVGTATIAEHPNTVLIAFPPGWMRERTGHYNVGEEFVVLSGAIGMSDDVHGAGSWVHVPGRAGRTGTRTPEGALALAWFDGPATWITDQPESSNQSTHVNLARAIHTAAATPFGPGRVLRRKRTWWVTSLEIDGHQDTGRQVLAPGGPDTPPQLYTIPPGGRLPDVKGPCMVRISEDR